MLFVGGKLYLIFIVVIFLVFYNWVGLFFLILFEIFYKGYFLVVELGFVFGMEVIICDKLNWVWERLRLEGGDGK